jgi:hypothetical protein
MNICYTMEINVLDKLNDVLSKIACFLFGHQNYRKVYSGKIGYYGAGNLGAQAIPVMDREKGQFMPALRQTIGTDRESG